MSEKYISADNLLQWIGERITCEALCSNSMKSDKGCDGNCILGEITPREKSIISVITESIKNAPAAPVEPVVRCGRCKYALIDAEGFVETCEYWNEEFNTFHLTTMHPDGYCSNGVERSGSGE